VDGRDDIEPMKAQEMNDLAAGRTAGVVLEELSAPDTEALLDRVFTAMEQGFQPDRAKDVAAVVQWNVKAPETQYSYHMIFDHGTCRALRGPAENPRTTLTLSLPDFLRFIGGDLSSMKALMTGKLKAKGDILFGKHHEGFFERS